MPFENIIIAGAKGVGKSIYGKNLAIRTGRTFFDTDTLIMKKFSFDTIGELFSSVGEKKFREIERECFLEAINDNRKKVVSTGGGFFYSEESIKLLPSDSIVLSLYLEPNLLWELNCKKSNLPAYIKNSPNGKDEFINRVTIINRNLKDISLLINIEKYIN